MYYLQSRYYNPEWGRFINADGIIGQTGELLGHNLFAYCKNNPISLKDDSGFLACSAVDGVSDGGTGDRNVGDKPVGGAASSGNLANRFNATIKDAISKFNNGLRANINQAEFDRQLAKYGTGGVKELEDGRVRFYGKLKEPQKPGEMAGARFVREWNRNTGIKRNWYETLDNNGVIRQVRPDPSLTGGIKWHYRFDENGDYLGKWSPN